MTSDPVFFLFSCPSVKPPEKIMRVGDKFRRGMQVIVDYSFLKKIKGYFDGIELLSRWKNCFIREITCKKEKESTAFPRMKSPRF